MSVYLSPSTQEKNIGVGNYGTEEKRMNQIIDIVEKILKDHNVKTYRNDPKMTLKEVVKDSNSKKCKIHFACHSNAYNKVSRGCEVFAWKKGCQGEKYAYILYKRISAITPTSDRGVKYGYNFYGTGKHMYEIANTTSDAVLIEIDFHDNTDSSKWIIDNIYKIGLEIAIGLLECLGIKYNFTNKKDYVTILKEVSKYSDTWIKFIKANKEINLIGLIEKLYYIDPK